MSISPLADKIISLLRERGALTAKELQSATRASQPSVSLAITALGERICRMGAARSTRYALTRDFYGLAATQPVYLTGTTGMAALFGYLSYLDDGRVMVRSSGGKQWLTGVGKLPWFLRSLQPQGFLGREYARLRPDFPSDPDQWSVEQILYLAVLHATDPPGAFSIGALTGRFIPDAPIATPERVLQYDNITARIGQTLPANSSAGGEQPKFVAEFGQDSRSYRHLIVKFSPPHGTPFGDRWRALLHLEKLALDTLRKSGVDIAESTIAESATRTYLESQRFDRIGLEGKRHVVTIDALHDEFAGGSRRHWIHTCEALAAKKMLLPGTVSAVARIYAFGQLIGNTDMHFGNLAFFVDDVAIPALRLAPLYDMLPMMWRPSIHSGDLDITPLRAQGQVPGYAREYADARQWAMTFWREAAQLGALNPEMRAACIASELRLRAD
jgi:hypothetical protein